MLASVERKLADSFGSPANVPDGVELHTDHDPQYTGADCAALCAQWHVAHTFAPVRRPTGNSVVERFIRTLKEELNSVQGEPRVIHAQWRLTSNKRLSANSRWIGQT